MLTFKEYIKEAQFYPDVIWIKAGPYDTDYEYIWFRDVGDIYKLGYIKHKQWASAKPPQPVHHKHSIPYSIDRGATVREMSIDEFKGEWVLENI